ncbi:glycosyltransferase [Mucilaginibacter antarcticus]|uniref:glycosyltransferase n=1 Tax=Mucilaginibacter antarcticus TaxID=1855725 RepID=UPI00362DD36F
MDTDPRAQRRKNILRLLQSIRDQDYQNYEVIILDDDSVDKTYQLCSAFANEQSNFRVIKGDNLPRNWLGKNYACHQLAAQAKGNFLLFVDADEEMHPGLINSAVHRMYANKLSLLSLFANQQMNTLSEMMVVPLMHYILLNLLPLRLVYLVKNYTVAAASGQFMLFDADSYRKHQWHQQVKHKIVEDVEIMRLVKSAGNKGEALLANGMISCRMYSSYREAVDGFSKNFLAAFNYNIIWFLIYIVFIIGGPMIILMTLNFAFVFFMVGLIVLTRVMISLAAGQNAWYNIILHPAQMFSLALVAFLAIQRHLTKTITWKGRKI